jgi:hypothetical protein
MHVVFTAFGPGGGAFLLPGTRQSDPYFDFLIGRWLWNCLPLVFAAMVADEAYEDGVRPILAYGAALLIGSFAGGFLDTVGGHVIGFSTKVISWAPNSFRTKQFLLQGSLGVAVYGYLRTTQHALKRVRASEADRIRDRQQLLAARLLALQARVEPQFLFDALSRIGDLHERDPETANALLADLIALLRAMLPLGNAVTSTVEREFALARAWSRVQRQLGTPFEIEITASPLAARSDLGPMVVLPMLQEMLAAPRGREFAWKLSAEPIASEDPEPRTPRLRVRLAPAEPMPARQSGSESAVAASIERLRERLAKLYGSAATLSILPLRDGIPAFVLDLPLAQETPADDHRADR